MSSDVFHRRITTVTPGVPPFWTFFVAFLCLLPLQWPFAGIVDSPLGKSRQRRKQIGNRRTNRKAQTYSKEQCRQEAFIVFLFLINSNHLFLGHLFLTLIQWDSIAACLKLPLNFGLEMLYALSINV